MTDTPDDRKAFATGFAKLAATLDVAVTRERMLLYFDALADLPLHAVLAAFDTARMAGSRFFPSPGELRDLAGAGGPDPGMVEAALVEQIDRHGTERPADPFLRLVVERLGGMYQVADLSTARRLYLLNMILPSCVVAARARKIPVPSQAAGLFVRPAQRNLQLVGPGAPPAPQLEAPRVTHEEAVAVLEQIGRHVRENQAADVELANQPDRIAARKAELREQAARLVRAGR